MFRCTPLAVRVARRAVVSRGLLTVSHAEQGPKREQGRKERRGARLMYVFVGRLRSIE